MREHSNLFERKKQMFLIILLAYLLKISFASLIIHPEDYKEWINGQVLRIVNNVSSSVQYSHKLNFC